VNSIQKITPFELKRLVQAALEAAKSALEKQETFLPGSIAVEPSGKFILAVAAAFGVDGSNLLITALRQKVAAEQLRGAAIYRDVRVRPRGAPEDVDAIQVVAELATGEVVHVFQVYRRNEAGQLIDGELEIAPADASIFVKAPREAARSPRWWQFWK
jgi:hypothetical protein